MSNLNPRAVIGGNDPPLSDRLELDHAELIKRAVEAEILPTIPPITSDDEAARYTESAADAKRILEDADKAFTIAKKPWLDGGRTVEDFFRFRVDLKAGVQRITTALGVWQTAKRAAAMKEQADAERREREAAQMFGGDEPVVFTPAAPPPKVVAIASASGAQAYGSVRWGHEVTDFDLVPKQYLMVNERALKAAVDGLKAQGVKVDDAQIPGVRIFEAVRAAIRK